jgi:AraC family transcriptional regulator of adaptative response / DNA-3-methyladenine glycosylase II
VLAARALARIEAGALDERGLASLAAELGVTDRHLRRVVLEALGASPSEIAQTHRLLTAKRLLTESALPLIQVAYAAGFGSVRRFKALFQERYRMAPSQLRRRTPAVSDAGLTLDLAARGPFVFEHALAFLRTRLLLGVESCADGAYTRTLQLGQAKGWIRVAPSPRGLALTVSETLVPTLRPLLAAVRGAFDLDTQIDAIDAVLAGDPALCVESDPYVRVTGVLDPFEAAARAVLGQQVTVEAGRTLAQRVTQLCGEALATGVPGLDRLFPSAEAIAVREASEIAALGMPRARAVTLVGLGRAVAEGRTTLLRGAVEVGRRGLRALDGVGPWTVDYVALRGLGDPDAFPAGDSALRAALGGDKRLDAKAESWRPWRAYAATRLWRAHARSRSAR